VSAGEVSKRPKRPVTRLDEPNALGIAVTERTTLTSTFFDFTKTTGATINGLLVGASYDEISCHLVSTVEAQLGVAVAL
jgi:hypothetical protein